MIQNTATETHNQMGCPYLNQTGAEAIYEWASVLANIDIESLPPQLQTELQQLRGRQSARSTMPMRAAPHR